VYEALRYQGMQVHQLVGGFDEEATNLFAHLHAALK
jgi:hypothetical protein